MDPRCKVLLACDFHYRYSANLTGGIARAGAAATLLSRDHDLEFGSVPGAAKGFAEAAIGDASHWRLHGRPRSPQSWLEALRLRRRARRLDPSVVHVQSSIGNDPRMAIASGLRRGRFAVTIHDPSPHPGETSHWRDDLEDKLLMRHAGLIFVHGEALREELIERFRPPAPVVVVPHGVAVGEATPVPAAPRLLFFGRISKYKGVDVLLDAMDAVWKAVPEAEVTIAGSGELDPHPALADPRVTLDNGYIADSALPGLFEACRGVVLPYRQASQSGVGSMVKPYGRPLVVTDVGGLPELVGDGSGLVAPSEDPAALATALIRVLEDDELAAGLARAGVDTAAREGSWDRVGELTLAAYREHLGVCRCGS